MAPVSDTRYKQQAVIEFLVAEKESVWLRKKVWGTFTDGCVLCMEPVQSIGAPFDAGFRKWRNGAAGSTVVWAPCHSHQPRHVAACQWHYSCGSVHHKLANGSIAISHQWKCNWFSMTMPVSEPKRQSPNLDGLCSPIPPIVLIWRSQIFIFLGYWRVHCVGQDLKMTRTWFVQWGHGYANRKWAGTGLHAIGPRWRKAVALYWDYVEK
jgi:hypothetical protein